MHCFLQHSPILEKLTLQFYKVPVYAVETKGIYKPVEQSIASKHLKIVEIKCAKVDERVYKISKVLTTNGIPLEQICIQQTYSYGSSGSGCKTRGFGLEKIKRDTFWAFDGRFVSWFINARLMFAMTKLVREILYHNSELADCKKR